MNIKQMREAIADAVSDLDGITCKPRPVANNVRAGDAWVNVGTTAPLDFTESLTTFTVVVVLGSDATRAEDRIEELSVPLVDVLTKNLGGTSTSVEPQALVGGTGVQGTLYALAATTSLIVSA